ncbi:MAG: 50S ribosomal protein L29 [Bdellovibrionota bacterium]
MKSTDKLKEFRGMSVEDLQAAISTTEQELLNLRFRHAAGQLEQTAQLTQLKRQVARAKTILNEKRSAA